MVSGVCGVVAAWILNTSHFAPRVPSRYTFPSQIGHDGAKLGLPRCSAHRYEHPGTDFRTARPDYRPVLAVAPW
jgi:hypothetical protein